MQASEQASIQVCGYGSIQVWLQRLSGGHLLVTVKVASIIFVNQLNATSKTQFQFQFELSLTQLSPSLFSRFC